MNNTYTLKVGRYNDFLVHLDDYLNTFPGEKARDRIGKMGHNKIISNSMLDGSSNQVFVQDFGIETMN